MSIENTMKALADGGIEMQIEPRVVTAGRRGKKGSARASHPADEKFDSPTVFCAASDQWTTVRREIAEEYAQQHDYPWIIGFSGGKDSTVVCHLVFEHLLSLPRSARHRSVHVVSNDTLVESPLVIAHVRTAIEEIRCAAEAFGLPVQVKITRPD